MPEDPRPPHIQRCTYQELRGGLSWQCKLTDPHEGVGHELPIDAEFGRDLDAQRPEWLAATLRDRVALQRHTQRRLDALQAIALQLAAGWAAEQGPGGGNGSSALPESTVKWLWANSPAAAEMLGLRR